MKAARWLLVAVLIGAFAYAGLSRISFNVEILKMLPVHLHQVQGLSMFLKYFAMPEELMITVEADDADTADAAATELAEHLRARPAVARRVVERAPWEAASPQMSEFLAFVLLNQPPEKIAALTASLAPDTIATTLAQTREKLGESIDPQEVAMLGYDPLGFTRALDFQRFAQGGRQSEFSSPDGLFRVIYVHAPEKLRNYKDNIAWIAALRAECEQWKGARAVKLGYTGEPAFVADIAGAMDFDMSTSGAVTLGVIAVIFWLCFRQWRPLLALQAMLVLTFVLALSTAGLVLKELTVMGVGFGAIMIGLCVDYGYFVFQRSRTVGGDARTLRRDCLQNVMWTGGTTAAAFFALNVSSLPGLSQLGSLVGIGVIVGATVMLVLFTPIALRLRSQATKPGIAERFFHSTPAMKAGSWLTAAVLVFLIGVLVVKGMPQLDFSANTLRPRVSGAYEALDRLYEKLTDDRNLLSLIVTGKSEDEVLQRLQKAEAGLAAAQARGDAGLVTTALPLWPHIANQRTNLAAVQSLVADAARLKQALLEAGFSEEAFGLGSSILREWQQWRERAVPIWPEGDASRWLMRRAAYHDGKDFVALGIVQPKSGRETALATATESEGVFLVSWKQLGRELHQVIPAEFSKVTVGLVGIVLVLLWFALRNIRDLVLFLGTAALVFVALAGSMSLFGMTWNLFNLAAILLLLGTGTDYSILLLLALRRNGGDIPAAHRELGLVIFLCSSSSAVGFATLGWANNIGLSSLGLTCALGLTFAALFALFLLPHARRLLHR